MNLIPGLSLRASEEAELVGIDEAEIGEFAYDYVEVTRNLSGDDVNAEKIDGTEVSPPQSYRGAAKA